MRLVHVLAGSDLGGSEVLCLRLARQLKTMGVQQEIVFLSDRRGPARTQAESLGLKVSVCSLGSGRLRFVWNFARHCRLSRAEAVLAYMFGIHTFVGLGAKLGGARSVLAFVGNPPPTDRRARSRTRTLARLGRWCTTTVVACSDYVRDAVVADYGLDDASVVRIHNWVDPDEFRNLISVEHRDPPRTIGMVARLDRIKDHATVVEAFALIAADFPGLRLVLAGDGDMRQSIVEAVDARGLSDRVDLLGSVNSPAEALEKIDAFVYATTRDEGFGLVLAEAMAARRPIVATAVGPVAEVLDDGRGGLLVPPADPAALASGIRRLLEDSNLRLELADGGFGLVQERYSVTAAADAVMALVDG